MVDREEQLTEERIKRLRILSCEDDDTDEPAVRWPWPGVSEMLGRDFYAGELVGLWSSSTSDNNWLLLMFVVSACRSGRRVLFYSGEPSYTGDSDARLVTIMSGVRAGGKDSLPSLSARSNDDLRRLRMAAEELKSWYSDEWVPPDRLDDAPTPLLHVLCGRSAEGVLNDAMNHNADLVVIDTAYANGMLTADVAADLKLVALQAKCVVIVSLSTTTENELKVHGMDGGHALAYQEKVTGAMDLGIWVVNDKVSDLVSMNLCKVRGNYGGIDGFVLHHPRCEIFNLRLCDCYDQFNAKDAAAREKAMIKDRKAAEAARNAAADRIKSLIESRGSAPR